MRSFKKTAMTALLFLLFSLLMCFALICTYAAVKPWYYQDNEVRKEMAGSIDTFVCGASHAIRGFVPEVFDQTAGTVSYNLSGSGMTMCGRYELLKKELERNPVRTVFLELSFDCMLRDSNEVYEGDYLVAARWDTFSETAKYLLGIRPSHWWNIFCHGIYDGGMSVFQKLTGGLPDDDKYGNRGYYPAYGSTILPLMTEEELKEARGTVFTGSEAKEENLDYLEKIIALTKEHGAELILVTFPLTNQQVVKSGNMDHFLQLYRKLAEDNNLAFYDFNLKKDIRTILDDETCYLDESHMNDTGARIFSKLLAETYLTRESFGESFETYQETAEAALTAY